MRALTVSNPVPRHHLTDVVQRSEGRAASGLTLTDYFSASDGARTLHQFRQPFSVLQQALMLLGKQFPGDGQFQQFRPSPRMFGLCRQTFACRGMRDAFLVTVHAGELRS